MKRNLNLHVGSGRGGSEKQRSKGLSGQTPAGTLWVWLMKGTSVLKHWQEAVAAYL